MAKIMNALYATINKKDTRVKWYSRSVVSEAKLLIIESKQDGVYLDRYSMIGELVADTWHKSVAEAKSQALFEYGKNLGDWKTIPDNHSPLNFVLGIIYFKNYKKYCEEL